MDEGCGVMLRAVEFLLWAIIPRQVACKQHSSINGIAMETTVQFNVVGAEP